MNETGKENIEYIGLWLPKELKDKVVKNAESENRTVSGFIRHLLLKLYSSDNTGADHDK